MKFCRIPIGNYILELTRKESGKQVLDFITNSAPSNNYCDGLMAHHTEADRTLKAPV